MASNPFLLWYALDANELALGFYVGRQSEIFGKALKCGLRLPNFLGDLAGRSAVDPPQDAICSYQ